MSPEEEDDLYNDLFVRTEECVDPEIIQNLKQKIETLQLEKDNLHTKVAKLEEIQKENQTLKTNISSLFKTAKNELERKTRMIDELRAGLFVGRSSQPDSCRHNSPTISNKERIAPSGCKDNQQKEPDQTSPHHSSGNKNSTSHDKHIGFHRDDRNRLIHDNDRYQSRHSRYADRHYDSRGYSEFRDDRKPSSNRVREYESSDRRTSESKYTNRETKPSSNVTQTENRRASDRRRETVNSKTVYPTNEKILSQDCDTTNSKAESATNTDSKSPTKRRSQSSSSSKNSNNQTNHKSFNPISSRNSTLTNIQYNGPSGTENTSNTKPCSLTNTKVSNPSHQSESLRNVKDNSQAIPQPVRTNLKESTQKPSWMLQSQPKPSPKPPPPVQKVVVQGPPILYNRRLEVRLNKELKKQHEDAMNKYLAAVNLPPEKPLSSNETMPGNSQPKDKELLNSPAKTTVYSNNPNKPHVSPKPTSVQGNSVSDTSSDPSILRQILSDSKQVSPNPSKSSPKVSASKKSNLNPFHTDHVASVLEKPPTTVKQTSPSSENKAAYKSLSDKIKEINEQNVHSSPVLEKKEYLKRGKSRNGAPKTSSEVSPKEITEGKAKCHGSKTTPEFTTTSKLTSYSQSIFEPEVQLHCESSCESNFGDAKQGAATPKFGIKQTAKPKVNSKLSRIQGTSSRLSRNLSNQFPSKKCALSSVDFIPVYNLESPEKQPARTESMNKTKTPKSRSPCLKLGDVSIKLTSPGKNLGKSAEFSILSPVKAGTITKVGTLTDPNSSIQFSPNQNNQNEANCSSSQPSVSTAFYDEESQDMMYTRRKRKFVIVDSADEDSLPASKKLILESDKQGIQETVIAEGDKHEKQDIKEKQAMEQLKENSKRLNLEAAVTETNGSSHVEPQDAEDLEEKNLQVKSTASLVTGGPVELTLALENSGIRKSSDIPEMFRQDTPVSLEATPDGVSNNESNVETTTETTASKDQITSHSEVSPDRNTEAATDRMAAVTEDKDDAGSTNDTAATVVDVVNQTYQVPICTAEHSEMSQITSDPINASDPNTSGMLDATESNPVNDISQSTNERKLILKPDGILTTTKDANVTPQNDSFSQHSEDSMDKSSLRSLNSSIQSSLFSARRENRFSLLSKRRPARASRVVVKKITISSPEKKEVIVLNANDNGKNSANDVTNDKCDLENRNGKSDQENKKHGEELNTSNAQNQVQKAEEYDEIVVKTSLSSLEKTTCITSNEPVISTQDIEGKSLKETHSLPQHQPIDMDTISNIVKSLPSAVHETLKQVSNSNLNPTDIVDNELNSTKSDCNVSTSSSAVRDTSASCFENNSSPKNNTIDTSSVVHMKSTELQYASDSDDKLKPTRERRVSRRSSSSNDSSNLKQILVQIKTPTLEGEESTLDANDIVGRVLRDGTKPVLNLNISKKGDAKSGEIYKSGDTECKENMNSQVENRSCTPNKAKEENGNEKMSEDKQSPITPVRQSSQTEPACKPNTPIRQPTITEPACSFQDMDICSDSKWKATNAELKNETFNYSGRKPKKRISHYVKPADGTPSPGSKATVCLKRTPDKKASKLSPLKKKLAQAINTSYKVASFRDIISTQPVAKTEKINVLTPRKSPKGPGNTPKTSELFPKAEPNTTLRATNSDPKQVTNATVELAKPNKTLSGSKRQSLLQREVQTKLKTMDTPATKVPLNNVNPMLKPCCVPTPEKMNTPRVTSGVFRTAEKPNTASTIGKVEDKKDPTPINPSISAHFLIPEALEENARFVSITSKASTITSTSTTSCTLEQSTRTSTKRFTSFESNSSSSLSLFTSTLSDVQFRNEHTISPFQDAVRLMNETPFKQLMTGSFNIVSPMAQTPYKSDLTSDVTQDKSTPYEDRIYPNLRTPMKPIITSSCDSETVRLQNLVDELALTPDGNSGNSVESGASGDPPANDLRCHVESMDSFQRETIRPCSSKNNGISAISSCQSVYNLRETVLKPDQLMEQINRNKSTDQLPVTKTINQQTTKETTDDISKHDREVQRINSTSENILSEAKTRRTSNSENILRPNPEISELKIFSKMNTKDEIRTKDIEIKEARRKSNSQQENMALETKKIHIVSNALQSRSTTRDMRDGEKELNKGRVEEQHRNRNKEPDEKQHNSSCDSQRLDSSTHTDSSCRYPNNRHPNDRNPNYGDAIQRDKNNRDTINRRKRRNSSSSPEHRNRSRHYSDRRHREYREGKEFQASPEQKTRERSKTPPNKIRRQSRSPHRRQRGKSSPERNQSPERKSGSSRDRRDRERDVGPIRKHRDHTRPDDRYRNRKGRDKSRRRDCSDRRTRYRDGSRGRTRKYSEHSSERMYRESSRERERRKYRESSIERSRSRQKGKTSETPVKKVIVKEILYYTESSIRGRSGHSEDDNETESRHRDSERKMNKDDEREERERDSTISRSRRSGNKSQKSETNTNKQQSSRSGTNENSQESTPSRSRRNEFHNERNETNAHRQEHSSREGRRSSSTQEPTSSRQDSLSSQPEQNNSNIHGTRSEHTRTSGTPHGCNNSRLESMDRRGHNDSSTFNRSNETTHNDANELNDSSKQIRKMECPEENKASSNTKRSSDIRSRTGRRESNTSANDSSDFVDSSYQMDSSMNDRESTPKKHNMKADKRVGLDSGDDEGLCSSSSNESLGRITIPCFT